MLLCLIRGGGKKKERKKKKKVHILKCSLKEKKKIEVHLPKFSRLHQHSMHILRNVEKRFPVVVPSNSTILQFYERYLDPPTGT